MTEYDDISYFGLACAELGPGVKHDFVRAEDYDAMRTGLEAALRQIASIPPVTPQGEGSQRVSVITSGRRYIEIAEAALGPKPLPDERTAE